MKKFILYAVIVIIALIIISAAILVLGNPDFMKELPQRLAQYHNTGNITVTVDGEKANLDDTTLTEGLFYIGSGETGTTTVIKDGEFRLRNGSYGENMFRFTVPVEGYGDVTVEFGHFNTNWWHEVHYTVNVDIITNGDGTLTANISQTVSYGGEEQFTHQRTHLLDGENNITTIYVGS